MNQLLSSSIDFVAEYAGVLAATSVATLLLAFVMLPFFIVRLPADYFRDDSRPPPLSRYLIVHLLLVSLKNTLGLMFVVLGFLMLFVPGQGLLTIIIGLTVMNYPGKFAIERWLVARPRVLPALNWLRRRYGEPPFDEP